MFAYIIYFIIGFILIYVLILAIKAISRGINSKRKKN